MPKSKIGLWQKLVFFAAVTLQTRQDRQDRQTGQTDRQQSDSIGQTVLQTVARKRFALSYRAVVCLSVCDVVYCDQTVGRIKMKLVMQVGLSPGHTVLDGDPPPLPLGKGHSSLPHSKFMGACVRIIRGPCLLWPNASMDQDAAWYGGRPRPRPHCVRWEPSSFLPKVAQPSNFWPMPVVAKRLDGSRCQLIGK